MYYYHFCFKFIFSSLFVTRFIVYGVKFTSNFGEFSYNLPYPLIQLRQRCFLFWSNDQNNFFIIVFIRQLKLSHSDKKIDGFFLGLRQPKVFGFSKVFTSYLSSSRSREKKISFSLEEKKIIYRKISLSSLLFLTTRKRISQKNFQNFV